MSARTPHAAREAPAPRRARRWLETGVIALLLAAIALSTYNAITTDRFSHDLDITRWVQRASLGSLHDVLFWMGVRGVSGAMIVGASVLLWLRGHRVEAALMGLLLVPDASTFILRDIFDRPRPPDSLVTVYGGPQGASYPSGTALHWVLFGGFTAYVLPRVMRRKVWAYALGGLLVLWTFVMGLWLIHHGRHWPSDVLGGYLYGLLFLALWIKLYPKALAWEARNPELLTMTTVRRVGAMLGVLRAP